MLVRRDGIQRRMDRLRGGVRELIEDRRGDDDAPRPGQCPNDFRRVTIDQSGGETILRGGEHHVPNGVPSQQRLALPHRDYLHRIVGIRGVSELALQTQHRLPKRHEHVCRGWGPADDDGVDVTVRVCSSGYDGPVHECRACVRVALF